MGVGPFAQRGLDEAFGLSIGLVRVGSREDMAQAEGFAGLPEGFGAVARAVVGHDAFDLDAEPGVIGQRGLEEGDRTFLLFVRHDLGEGEARGVVDCDMDELPAGAAMIALAAAIAGDAMADLIEAPEFFDVDADEFVGAFAFVAVRWLGRLQAVEAIEAEPAQDAVDDGGLRDADRLCDLATGPAPASQRLDLRAGSPTVLGTR